MENQFTVGPWRVEGNQHLSSGLRVNVRVCSGTDLIADVPQIENARLIAAAPALYEALKQSSEIIEALLLGTITKEQRYSETARASKNMAAALALVDSNDDDDEPETATCEDCGEIDTIGALESGNHWCEKGKL